MTSHWYHAHLALVRERERRPKAILGCQQTAYWFRSRWCSGEQILINIVCRNPFFLSQIGLDNLIIQQAAWRCRISLWVTSVSHTKVMITSHKLVQMKKNKTLNLKNLMNLKNRMTIIGKRTFLLTKNRCRFVWRTLAGFIGSRRRSSDMEIISRKIETHFLCKQTINFSSIFCEHCFDGKPFG